MFHRHDVIFYAHGPSSGFVLPTVCLYNNLQTSVQTLNIVLNADNTKCLSVSGFTCSYCHHGTLCVSTITSGFNSILCPGCSFYSNKLQLGKNVCCLIYLESEMWLISDVLFNTYLCIKLQIVSMLPTPAFDL